MRANVVIRPGAIIGKTASMNQHLSTLDESANGQLLHIRQSISNEAKALLMGDAWDTILQYMESIQIPLLDTYRLWIREQKEANNRYCAAAQALPQITLDRWWLERELDGWQDSLSDEQSEEEPSYSAIRFYRRMIRETEAKLRSIDQFLSRTNQIYHRAEEVLAVLNRA